MKFKAKRDTFFKRLLVFIVLFVNIPLIVPTFFIGETDVTDILIIIAIAAVVSLFMVWLVFGITYELRGDHLYVRGGPFRSRIKYEEITRVSMNPSIWDGYRILSAKDAIEIHYKSAILGSIKISPEPKQSFIEELKKRNPCIKID